MIRVINFSGGKTSALMTILNYRPGDLVIFADTGREHPKTYKFINDFEAFENIPIIRIQYEGGFRGMLEHNKWKHIPNRVKRSCIILNSFSLLPSSLIIKRSIKSKSKQVSKKLHIVA